jgi:hypothetical protein
MVIAKIGQEYTLLIPDEFHQMLKVGQEVALSTDPQGRLVITPLEQLRTALQATFGIWSDRPEAQTDSVDLVNELRQGERLDKLI